jgi:hypothetical protein
MQGSNASPAAAHTQSHFQTQVHSCVRAFLAVSRQNRQKAPQMMVCAFSVRKNFCIQVPANHGCGKSQENSGVLIVFDLLNWLLCFPL